MQVLNTMLKNLVNSDIGREEINRVLDNLSPTKASQNARQSDSKNRRITATFDNKNGRLTIIRSNKTK